MSTARNCPTLATIRAAFGPGATLYTVLGCNVSSTPDELKRAYRKAALRYHPDRAAAADDGDGNDTSTLKFQAVSAAYQVLMDAGRRSVYDATGRIVEEEDHGSSGEDDGGEVHAAHAKSRKAPRGTSQNQWEQFFHSVFHEIISTGARHASAAGSYRGSEEERKDVLHYYTMCRGDWNKVVECMIHGSPSDVVRWRRDIVEPAVAAGEVVDGGIRSGKGSKKKSIKKKRVILEDSSSDDEEVGRATSSGKKRPRKGLLVDTDEEEEDDISLQQQSSLSAASASSSGGGMSKKDKMDYRVAKKRKAKAKKEMEMADIIQSKDWGGAVGQQSRRRKKQNAGGISDALLSNIERKYGKRNGR